MRIIKRPSIPAILLVFVLLPLRSHAQETAAPADAPVDAAVRSEVIDKLISELNDGYVFVDVAKKMEADLRRRQTEHLYESITSSRAFAEQLTKDLQSISKDKHLRVRYSPQPIPVRAQRSEPTEAEKEQFAAFNRRVNYGFERVERLNGNIGYVDLRGFFDPDKGAETVSAAMTFLANTNALIFDLRQNGGGDPAMVALISSYLFGDKPVHLNDLYFRQGDTTTEFWTKPEVASKKFPDKDIYVLTSSRTFSGAEEFSNNLKVLKRATIIGETTGGGANPGGTVRLTEHFGAFVPLGRAVNPVTKTNWEGTGVSPDISVPQEQALNTAYLLGLKKALENTKDDGLKIALRDLIDQKQKELAVMKAKQ